MSNPYSATQTNILIHPLSYLLYLFVHNPCEVYQWTILFSNRSHRTDKNWTKIFLAVSTHVSTHVSTPVFTPVSTPPSEF